ncbi:hypothetical protein K5549_002048 [Capra hircus]|nr:hypothetical protein K5549_002048 [Capra hircus]
MTTRIAALLKNVWAKEAVLGVSFSLGGLAVILPALSPYTECSLTINQATPYNYPGRAAHGVFSLCCSMWVLQLWHTGCLF